MAEYEVPLSTGDKEPGMKKTVSLHSFTMKQGFDHEDEGTAVISGATVVKVMDTVKDVFPGALTVHQLAKAIKAVLEERNNPTESTLLCTSFCCDEVNRDLEDELRNVYGNNFSIGGLAGFAFGGVTAWGVMAHHIPIGGSCLVLYGPHAGVDYDGVVGKVNRKGHHGSGACCASANAAMAYVKAVTSGVQLQAPEPDDPIDAQQLWVGAALLKHSDRLNSAPNPHQILPHALYESQKELMVRILDKGSGDVVTDGAKIAVLGGIQINTPEGTPEYFLPLSFELRNNKNELVEDLMDALTAEAAKNPAGSYFDQSKSKSAVDSVLKI